MGIMISNFFTRLFVKKDVKIVMVGVDGAGKTTILYKLKTGETFPSTIPTIGHNVETLIHKNISLTIWDVGAGGHGKRPLWRHYYTEDSAAIILVIDSSYRERLEEAKQIAWDLLDRDELRNAVLLILANKQDLRGAIAVDELKSYLELYKYRYRKWYIHPTCATKGTGLNEALDWLTTELTK